jgi:hypothetical protein
LSDGKTHKKIKNKNYFFYFFIFVEQNSPAERLSGAFCNGGHDCS